MVIRKGSLCVTKFDIMNKMLIMAYFILSYTISIFSTTLYAPGISYKYKPITIEFVQPIIKNTYEPLIEAIFQHESGNNTLAYNALENAVGGLQIRQCRVDHYNKLTGKNYTLTDMYDFNIAKEVFLYFAEGKSFEQAAKKWNGSGPMTEVYWESIKAILNRKRS